MGFLTKFLTDHETSLLAQHVQTPANIIKHLLVIILQIFMPLDGKIYPVISHTVIYLALDVTERHLKCMRDPLLASDNPP